MHHHPAVAVEPLKTRNALYGGRTEAMRLHHKINDNETIEYCDVMSLYPFICKTFKFPVGHPAIHVAPQDAASILFKEGILKCKILPPSSLYHSVLPARINGRLIFCSCRKCAEIENQNNCTHNREERSSTGTWIIDEVRKAVIPF